MLHHAVRATTVLSHQSRNALQIAVGRRARSHAFCDVHLSIAPQLTRSDPKSRGIDAGPGSDTTSAVLTDAEYEYSPSEASPIPSPLCHAVPVSTWEFSKTTDTPAQHSPPQIQSTFDADQRSVDELDNLNLGSSAPDNGAVPISGDARAAVNFTDVPDPQFPSLLRCSPQNAAYRHMVCRLSRHSSAPPSLSDLLAYHARVPLSKRSVRSYNLLIRLALRHRQFKTVKRLMEEMNSACIDGNLESWKLGVRWLVRMGKWDNAWKQAMQFLRSLNNFSTSVTKSEGQKLPLCIWLEFLGTAKVVSLRKWRPNRHGRGGKWFPIPNSKVRFDVDLARYQLLMRHFPVMTPEDIARGLPRTIYFIVRMLLRTGQGKHALQLTRSYLHNSTAQTADRRWLMQCLDILHVHIVFGTTKRGVAAHFLAYETVKKLLALHPRLRPDSTTTLLLLSPLKRAKKCASVGWRFVRQFRKQWGERVVDNRVRRRIAMFALKEGRSDILAKMKVTGSSREAWVTEEDALGVEEKGRTSTDEVLVPPDRQIFPGLGKERRRWRSITTRN